MAYKVPKLPKSSKKIILLLSEAGTLTQKELIIRSNIPAKTVRYALKKLDEQDLIISTPNLEDMRSAFYTLNPDFNSVDMEMHINDARQVLYAELSN